MIARRTNPSQRGFATLGGRGIEVCPRWRESFEAFVVDVGERPAGARLFRLDSAGDFKPGNVAWAAPAPQRAAA